jgi:hypothetical protein
MIALVAAGSRVVIIALGNTRKNDEQTNSYCPPPYFLLGSCTRPPPYFLLASCTRGGDGHIPVSASCSNLISTPAAQASCSLSDSLEGFHSLGRLAAATCLRHGGRTGEAASLLPPSEW